MRKFLKVLAVLLAMAVCFLAGWRLMPRIWPAIKTGVVYPVFPALEPAPAPTAQPYAPKSNASLSDEIGETDSLVYYFYKPYCPYCREIEPLMAGLPQTVTLPDGAQSAVKLVAVDKLDEEQAQLIASYYETYKVPEERRYVPAVVIGNRHLMPGSEIIDQLLDALTAGEGLRTPLLDGSARSSQ